MAKKKVWELAREISVGLNEVLNALKDLGIKKANHLEFLEPEEETRVRSYFQDKSARSAETTVVSRNVVRRRRTTEGIPDQVPETVPAVVVAMPEAEVPAPEAPEPPAPEPEAAEPTAAEPAPAPVEVAPAPVEAGPVAPVAPATPAPAGPSAAVKPPLAGSPAAIKAAEDAKAAAAKAEEDKKKKPLVKAVEGTEEDDRGRKGVDKNAKKGRRIVVDRSKRPANLRRAIFEDADGEGDDRTMPVVEERDTGRRSRRMAQRGTSPLPTKAEKRVIRFEEFITVSDLAHAMSTKAGRLVKRLVEMGVMAGMNASLDLDTATIIAEEYGYTVERITKAEEKYLVDQEDAPESLQTRPPVITIMGHVDHGKTSLLDVIQKTDLAAQEAGGITQAVGAYRVDIEKGTLIFLDTPGHEAFTAMRARGAKVTDMVILVVAADDGVQPQTIEAIHHAQDAGVPIVVAVNKIDKDNADPERCRRELSEHGLLCEDWGGQTVFVDVSAKQKKGVDTLLDLVLLQAEMLELTANPDAPASGFVIESRLDRQTGSTCTVIVKRGTLEVGDLFVAGACMGRVRSMVDEHGAAVNTVRPSYFAEITGLAEVPQAGDVFFVVETEREAREIVEKRQNLQRKSLVRERTRPTLESLFSDIQSGELQELKLIVKGDVQGSVEALRGALDKLPSNKVVLKVIHAAVGGITASDIQLAAASDAIVVGFNVRGDVSALSLAASEGVEIKTYAVIYDLLDDVRAAMEGMLAPRLEEKPIGSVEVRQIFTIPKVGIIAGSYVLSGKVVRNSKVRLYRNDIKVYEGKISSLKRVKDDAREVAAGFECGIGIENYNDLKVGDVLEVIEIYEVKETL
jgi:translation initiation factor IF-2